MHCLKNKVLTNKFLVFIIIQYFLFLAGHIIRQVVQGLLYLHSHRILHRDMSLSNLLLTRDMQVVSKIVRNS